MDKNELLHTICYSLNSSLSKAKNFHPPISVLVGPAPSSYIRNAGNKVSFLPVMLQRAAICGFLIVAAARFNYWHAELISLALVINHAHIDARY